MEVYVTRDERLIDTLGLVYLDSVDPTKRVSVLIGVGCSGVGRVVGLHA